MLSEINDILIIFLIEQFLKKIITNTQNFECNPKIKNSFINVINSAVETKAIKNQINFFEL